MREIETVFMLVRERRGRMGVLYHRPGKTAREAWDYAIAERKRDPEDCYLTSKVEESLRTEGWKAKRIRLFLVEH